MRHSHKTHKKYRFFNKLKQFKHKIKHTFKKKFHTKASSTSKSSRKRSSNSNIQPIPSHQSVQCMKDVYWKETSYADVVRKVCARCNEIERSKTYVVVNVQLCTYNRKFRSTDRTVSIITYRKRNKDADKTLNTIFQNCYSIRSEREWPQRIQEEYEKQTNGTIVILGLNCDAYHSVQNARNSMLVDGALGVGSALGNGLSSGVNAFNNVLNGGGMFTDSRFLSVFYRNV